MKTLKILLIVSVGILFFGCSKDGGMRKKNHFRMNISSEPGSFNPGEVRTIKDIGLIKLLYDGLTRISLDGKIEMAIAESYDISSDGKKYTFHIRDAYWNNNEKMTSYDFEKTWKRTLSPGHPSSMAFLMYIIRGGKNAKEGKISVDEIGMSCPDEKTIVVDLEYPAFHFLELLSQPIFFPSYLNSDKLVTNGPFNVDKVKKSDYLTLIRNETYWDKRNVKLDLITCYFMSQETELLMYNNKELDWAGSPYSTLTIDSIEDLRKRNDFYKVSSYGTYFLSVNTNKNNLLSSKDFRKLISSKIKRDQIVEHLLLNQHRLADTIIPNEGFNAYLQSSNNYENFNEDYSNTTISIMYSHDQRNHLIIQAIQKQIEEELKINVKLEALESKVFFDRLKKGEYDLALRSWIADYNDPSNFLSVFKDEQGTCNYSAINNKNYSFLLEKANYCNDLTQRQEYLVEAANILSDEMPIIPLFHLSFNYLCSDKIKNVLLTPLGYLELKWAYIE